MYITKLLGEFIYLFFFLNSIPFISSRVIIIIIIIIIKMAFIYHNLIYSFIPFILAFLSRSLATFCFLEG